VNAFAHIFVAFDNTDSQTIWSRKHFTVLNGKWELYLGQPNCYISLCHIIIVISSSSIVVAATM